MPIRKALFSYIILIFQIFIFAVCYDKIFSYSLYHGERPLKLNYPKSGPVEFATRIVMDLLQRTYINKGIISIAGNASTITITGDCDIERPCWALEWLAENKLEFECSNVCRYLTFEGNLYNFSVDMNGYYLLTERLVGCYMNNETMTVSAGSGFKCPSSHMGYFGVQETDVTSGLQIICIKSLFHLKKAKIRECNMFCTSAPRRVCGGSGKRISVYSYSKYWGIDLSVDCFYRKRYCAPCPEGREGLNCERIVCTKNNGGCGNGSCESVDDFNISICTCDIGFDVIVGTNNVNCLDEDECKRVTCDSNAIRCLNNPGSYVCECKDGFINAGPSTCEDIDECAVGTDGCDDDTTDCKNIPSYYTCNCKPGFHNSTSLGTRQYCSDVDECASSLCGSHAECENSPGSFHCECYAGYQLESPTKCIDIDECALGTDSCDDDTTDCKNIPSYYTCNCKPGFHNLTSLGTRQYCSDVDECRLTTHSCHAASSTCENTIGSYICECKTGFERESDRECSDINECSKDVCDSISTSCVNTPGSFRCNCKVGFEGGSATRCEDIDECERVDACHGASTYCTNAPGTYRCDCKRGFVRETDRKCSDIDECIKSTCDTTSTTCQNIPGTYLCSCKFGFSGGSHSHCEDIDECARDTCDRGSTTCRNTPGSFQCNCIPGFRRKTPTACEDIDECLSNIHACHKISTTCDNQPGTYECKCSPGFSGRIYFSDGAMSCPDIDECLDSKNCDVSTTSCQNTPGSFSCNCKIGFSRLTRYNCEDINECLGNPCDLLTTTCSNNVGSFSCECMGGYLRETLFKCEDLDECEQSHPCDIGTTYCKNIPGSFECNCRVGFQRENLLRCKDIDECALLMHNCGKQSLCTNIVGSFTCKCPPGTEAHEYKYTMECKDIDECELPNNCDVAVSVCLNVVTSYICQCYPGYISRDNFSCIKRVATISTTLHDDDMEYDEITTESGNDVATGGDYRNLVEDDYWILFPLFLFFMIGFFCWCYVMSKNQKSRASSVTTYSFRRISGISRGTMD